MHDREHAVQRAPMSAPKPSGQDAAPAPKREALRGLDYAAQVQMLAPSENATKAPSADNAEQEPTLDPPTWAETVRANFANWDADGDGFISRDEAEDRYASGKDGRVERAALRSLKLMLPELQRTHKDGKGKDGPKGGLSVGDIDAYAKLVGKDSPGVRLIEGGFTEYQAKLANADGGQLFGKSGKPDYTKLQQGDLSTCYFLAPLTALAKNDPQAIVAMIAVTPGKEGQPTRYTVTFPNQAPIEVVLSDEHELMRQSWAIDDGLWVTVLERAFASHRAALQAPKEGGSASEGDKLDVAEWGFAKEGVELLTGHASIVKMLAKSKPEEIDELLTEAMAKGAIATTDTPRRAKKGSQLQTDHEFAIIGYAGGRVTLRNPRGPGRKEEPLDAAGKVADGLDDGEITMSLAELIAGFEELNVEQR